MYFHSLFILIIFLFSSCVRFERYSNPGVKIVHDLQKRNNKKLATIGIYTCTFGGHSTGQRVIDGMYVTNRYRFTSIDQAREFFVAFVDEYTKPFKEEPRIRPYLHNYPLTDSNFEFMVSFYDDKGQELQRPYIQNIMNLGDKIYYSTCDLSVKPSSQDLFEETFEEARARLKSRG
jgi:hypothetical protein